MSRQAPQTLVPVEPPTLRPVRSRTRRIVAIEAASGTWIIRSTMSGRNEGSTRWRPMPSMRDGRPVKADEVAGPARVEDRVVGVDDAQLRRVLHQARVAADRRARAAGARAVHDPGRDGVPLQRHLVEDRLGDVVVAAPVRRALRVRELVEEVAAALVREPLRVGARSCSGRRPGGTCRPATRSGRSSPGWSSPA